MKTRSDRRTVAACLAAGMILFCQQAVMAQQVRQVRPRILLDQQTLGDIARRCDEGGPSHAVYEAMKEWLAQRAMNPASGYHPGSGNSAIAMGLAYRIEKQLGRDGSRYLEHLRTKAWRAPGDGISNNFGWDAILFDWLYDELEPDERQARAEELGRALRHHTRRPEITLDGGTYWYNQTWSPYMGVSWSRDGIAPKTIVALAILGENTSHEADARQWLDSFATRMRSDFLEKFDELGGVWPEGAGHGAVLYAPFIAWEAWRFATGEDLFAQVGPAGFHREAPYWQIFARLPHTNSWAVTDDIGPGSLTGGSHVPIEALHAARYRDGVTQSIAARAGGDAAAWAHVIWFDPEVPRADPASLPLSYHFKGSGYTFMRSGWGSADDTWALFSAGPYFTAYGTWGGNGTFQIVRQGLLAGNAGYLRYSMHAGIHQNVMLVYDPQERFFSHSGNPRRNDGGPQIPTPWHVTTPMERGKTVAYEHNDQFTYLGADLTNAYSHTGADPHSKQRFNSEKIRSYTRQFLYLRGEPEFFVVYDRVDAANADFPKTWLLHVPDEPRITAGGQSPALAAAGPGFNTFQDVDSAFVAMPGRRSRHDNWRTDQRGALAVRTLLPHNARITRRGGEGFDMWGNPHDPDASNWTDPEADRIQSQINMCYWRLEVEPPDRQEYQRFLHVLIPYRDAEGKRAEELSPGAADFELIEDDQRDGLRLQHNTATWEVTFAKRGPLAGSVRITRAGDHAVETDLPGDIKPNQLPKGLAISPPRSK